MIILPDGKSNVIGNSAEIETLPHGINWNSDTGFTTNPGPEGLLPNGPVVGVTEPVYVHALV